MHVIVVHIHVKPEHVADFVEAIRESRGTVRRAGSVGGLVGRTRIPVRGGLVSAAVLAGCAGGATPSAGQTESSGGSGRVRGRPAG